MKLLNIGSLNIDKLYHVQHFVAAGETVASFGYEEQTGGKGLNQSIAAARAGLEVRHGGKVGNDGKGLVEFLRQNQVDVSGVKISPDLVTGHAVIQVDSEGQNCILLYGGANQAIEQADIDEWLGESNAGDLLLLQNEISGFEYILHQARQKKLRVILNPSPITPQLLQADLSPVSLLLLNEIEGGQLTGETETRRMAEALEAKYPTAEVVLTLGAEGAMYIYRGNHLYVPACKVENVVDTTAAGDTFTGYFISAWADGMPVKQAMQRAACASAIAIGRLGAAGSIPFAKEVDNFIL